MSGRQLNAYVHLCICGADVEFEWDERKARTNRRKHGVDFAEAAIIFEDDRAITVADEDPAEERFATLGSDGQGRHLVVIYTVRGERIRIISARQATQSEREEYEKQKI